MQKDLGHRAIQFGSGPFRVLLAQGGAFERARQIKELARCPQSLIRRLPL